MDNEANYIYALQNTTMSILSKKSIKCFQNSLIIIDQENEADNIEKNKGN